MSELFMECEEEELEPWQQQQQIPQVNLVDDDDDEPIFIGELSTNQKNNKTAPGRGRPPGKLPIAPLRGRGRPPKATVRTLLSDAYSPNKAPPPPPPVLKKPTAVSTPAVGTITRPQPVMVNNQGFIVTPSELSTNRELITALGKQYPPGTTFTIFPAGQPQLLQPMSQASVMPGVVHRPQVQQINNNIVTLSNVQHSPASFSMPPQQTMSKPPGAPQALMQPAAAVQQSFASPINKADINRIDQAAAKRKFVPQQSESLVKRTKVDSAPVSAVVDLVDGGGTCPRCSMEFSQREQLKFHMKICTVAATDPADSNKRIMLVSDFYYGRYEGDPQKQQAPKTNTTFKCQTCLKILKNNIRFMNHMKHHLELEKQNSESYESHTTCQHCYRQYSTPFQLQCHIESAHTAVESSTNCKICELAFESEQVLLEHMKDTHKPGEMPYGCMVCNFRSSLFSDVENHFRSMHENTKDLLCPFCLKIHRTTHTYMNHYMKHQRKGIQRCGKCRLNFLTYKEKVDHKTQFHKTFRKPKALEGLPAGTKVTIRASYLGNPKPGPAPPPELYAGQQETKLSKSPAARVETYPTPKVVSTVSVLAKMVNEKVKTKKVGEVKNDASAKRKTKNNLALKNLSVWGGSYTCIECHAQISDFFSHYPVMVNCGACNYRTSCKESFANHMIRFHSSITKKGRKWKTDRRKSPNVFKSTLVCLTCDLITNVHNGDAMTKHLIEKPNHICRVIQEQRDDARLEPTTEVLFMVASAAQPKPPGDAVQVESVEVGGTDLSYDEVTFEGTDDEVTFEGVEPVAFEGVEPVTFEGVEPVTFEGVEPVTFEGAGPPVAFEGVEPAVAFEGVEPVTFEGTEPPAVDFEGVEPVAFEGAESPVAFEGVEPVMFEGTEPPVASDRTDMVAFEGTDEASKQSSSPLNPDPVGPILVEEEDDGAGGEDQLKTPLLPAGGGTLGATDPSEQSAGGSPVGRDGVELDTDTAAAPMEAPASPPAPDSLSNHIVVLDEPGHGDTPEDSVNNNTE